ncbi:ribonuclease D [Gordonia sputi]|uniref:ribonuclease D n=1 Tax=Gordonia sputi TaxID=36823 RepID=UPI00226F78FA|nr:ribonuclease D [Gordonia sputi]
MSTSDERPADSGSEVVAEPLLAPADGVPPVLSRAAEFAEAAERLAAGTGPVAVDTERASGYRYSQRAYLVQLRRTGSGSFLLDPISEPETLAPVIEALDGPEWVLHAADQDLPCLRELGFRCETVFDTELAGRLLGEPKVNLAAMVATYLELGLQKGHGAADWSRRPLPDDWLNYAALDVEVLVELRDAVQQALVEQGKDEWARQEFRYVLDRPAPAPRVDKWRRTANVHTVKNSRSLAAVRELWAAREELAQRRDVAPGRILPDSAIVTAANAMPTSQAELTRLPVFGGPRQRRQAGIWLGAIDRARSLSESQLPSKRGPTVGLPPIRRWEQRNPDAAKRIAQVRPIVKEIAENNNLPLENLLAPDLVRQLAWDGVDLPATPDVVDAYLAAGGARPWQRELTDIALADGLNAAAKAPAAEPDSTS